MNVSIERQKPIPASWGRRLSPITEAIMQLKVGDAVAVENTSEKERALVRGLASHYSKKLQCLFRTKVDGDVIRIWRLA